MATAATGSPIDAHGSLVVIDMARLPGRQSLARELAAQLNAALAADGEVDSEFRLIVSDERIELCDRRMKVGQGVSADFSAIDRRSASRSEPIARAMGRGSRTIIDATAGLGKDSFRLASLGFEVTAIERSPIVAALLNDGLRAARTDQTLSHAMLDRVRLVVGDAREALTTLPRPDVVYLDPMYPPKRKEAALPKKRMQILQALLGPDIDSTELFELAMRQAIHRVVVKRPTYAPPLTPHPVASHEGKLARFDVYVPHARAAPLRR